MKRTLWLPFGVGLVLATVGLGGCVRPRANVNPTPPQVSYAPTTTQSSTVVVPEPTVTLSSPEASSTSALPATAEPEVTATPVEVVVEEPTAEVVNTPTPTAAASQSGETSGAESTTSYEVRWGDTLSGIASRFGVTIDAIMALNPRIADRNQVYAGWVLIIPSGAVDSTPVARETGEYVVQRGDTLSGIARSCGTTLAALLEANPWITNQNYVQAGRRLVIPVGGDYTAPRVHIVADGETLSAIAVKYNTTIWAIVVQNNLPNANYIFAGQRLLIP